MDFPKKQAQRLIPLYLLEYSEKLFTNHPDPSAPWGGGGGDYTAGYGITITNDIILVDTNVIAKKSDIPSLTNYVTTTQLTDALDDYALKTEIPTDVSQLYNDAGYATQTWVENQNYLPSSDFRGVYQADVEMSLAGNKVFPHYSGIEYSKEFEDKRLTIKLEDMDNENRPTIMVSDHERTYIYPGHVDAVSPDNQTFTQMDYNGVTVNTNGGMNHTTFRQGGFEYNNIHFNLNSNKQELENYTIATLDDIPLSTITTLESLALDHTTQINSINSNITDLQTLTSTHTSQISGINSSITSLESLVNINTSNISTIENNLSTISSNITTLEELTSTHTSQISALQTSVSNCVTLSQLSTTLSDYALKSEVPSYSLSTTSTPVLSSATLSQSYETLTFTYSDNTTASFNFLTTGTTLSTSTVNVLDSATLS